MLANADENKTDQTGPEIALYTKRAFAIFSN